MTNIVNYDSANHKFSFYGDFGTNKIEVDAIVDDANERVALARTMLDDTDYEVKPRKSAVRKRRQETARRINIAAQLRRIADDVVQDD